LSSWFTIVSFTDGSRLKNAGKRVRTHSQRGGFVTKGETAGDVKIDEDPSSLRRYAAATCVFYFTSALACRYSYFFNVFWSRNSILDREI